MSPDTSPSTAATGYEPESGSAMARFLRAMRTRLRLVWAWAVASLLAPVVAAAALLLVLLGRVRPWAWPEPTALAVAIGAVLVLVAVAIGQPLSWLAAARAADKGLGARDIFTSALQFKNLDDEFGSEIRYRAERLAAHDTPSSQAGTAVPFPGGRRTWIRWALAGVLAIVAVALAVGVNPQDAERRRLELVEARAGELAEQVEELADQVAEEPGADPALAAELSQLAEDLRQVDSLEEAAQLLDEQAADLAADRSPDFASQQAAAQGLERSLATRPLPGEPSGSPAEQLAELAEGLDELSSAEQEELAERLAELSEAQAAGDPATAAALGAAAQQLAAGDVAGAQAALGEGALAQAANADSVASQQASAQASGQLSNLATQARSGQTSAGSGSGEGQGEGEGSGEGDGSGDGSGEGSGQGSGEGAGSGQGAGSGSGSGQGAGGQGGSGAQGTVGGAAGGSGQGQGGAGRPGGFDQPNIEGDNSGFTIVDPSALADGDPLELGGTLTGEGQTETVGRGEGLTTTGRSRIPVSDIIGDYSQRASEALERNRLSPSQQELVGNYFDRLTTGGP